MRNFLLVAFPLQNFCVVSSSTPCTGMGELGGAEVDCPQQTEQLHFLSVSSPSPVSQQSLMFHAATH